MGPAEGSWCSKQSIGLRVECVHIDSLRRSVESFTPKMLCRTLQTVSATLTKAGSMYVSQLVDCAQVLKVLATKLHVVLREWRLLSIGVSAKGDCCL